MILSAVQITDKFSDDMASICDTGINGNDPVFETNCYNEHFFDVLQNRYKSSFPRLTNYTNPTTTSKQEINDYLIGVEGFARDNPDPTLPINKRDSVLIVGSLLNIETTFIRFDTNRNNIIDYSELKEAFKVYKSAIISMANLKPSEEGYAESIFYYMVSKMEIPPTGSWMRSAKFFAYHSCVSTAICRKTIMSKIEAKRLNIGKLLFYLVDQAAKAQDKDKKPL